MIVTNRPLCLVLTICDINMTHLLGNKSHEFKEIFQPDVWYIHQMSSPIIVESLKKLRFKLIIFLMVIIIARGDDFRQVTPKVPLD